ncbi:MAG TPA: maleylpyruvate isomerase N-terminal domain-containing protein [Dehalococcoidia bacterium]|nr:maleylpyruvate isomerase N-terminal domain-containing protein [Dehalococcoidia bacterium]
MDPYVHDAVLDMLAARNELTSALSRLTEGDWQRFVPYGDRTLHDLLAHVAGFDGAWAQSAQGLLRGEAEQRPPLSAAEARAARERAIDRGRALAPQALLEEMERRRLLLLSLYDLLEPRHLALALRSFGDEHNSVRERIWLAYHDRLHAADVSRALRMTWHPQRLRFRPELAPAVEALAPDETLYVIYSVDPVLWERPSPLPGWTYRQLLAHIATGDWVLQGHLRHIIEQGDVAPWPDIDAGNADRLAERAYTPASSLTEEYLSMRHETLRLLSQLEPAHLRLNLSLWWQPPPNERSLLDYLLGFERHDRAHREQLRGAMKYAHARGGA